jgi:hypothetical protein
MYGISGKVDIYCLSSPVPKDKGFINFFRENRKNSYILKEAANFIGFGLKKKLKSKGICWYLWNIWQD